MNQIKGSGCEHMKFLTFGTSLHKMKHPIQYGGYLSYKINKVSIRVTSKLYDFINNDDRNTVVTHKLWLGE